MRVLPLSALLLSACAADTNVSAQARVDAETEPDSVISASETSVAPSSDSSEIEVTDITPTDTTPTDTTPTDTTPTDTTPTDTTPTDTSVTDTAEETHSAPTCDDHAPLRECAGNVLRTCLAGHLFETDCTTLFPTPGTCQTETCSGGVCSGPSCRVATGDRCFYAQAEW